MEKGSGIGIAAGLAIAAVTLVAVWIGERQDLGGSSQWSYALHSGESMSSGKAGK